MCGTIWRLLRMRPMQAIIAAHVAHGYGVYTLQARVSPRWRLSFCSPSLPFRVVRAGTLSRDPGCAPPSLPPSRIQSSRSVLAVHFDLDSVSPLRFLSHVTRTSDHSMGGVCVRSPGSQSTSRRCTGCRCTAAHSLLDTCRCTAPPQLRPLRSLFSHCPTISPHCTMATGPFDTC